MSGPRRRCDESVFKINHNDGGLLAMKDQRNHEALKQWLRRYRELRHDADRLYTRLDELLVRAESARTTHLDGQPHGSMGDADRIGAIAAELEELQEEVAAAQQAAADARREISAAIRQISGNGWAARREVLRLRYIDCLPWTDCAERLYGDDPQFWDRPEGFLRRVYRLHSQALDELENQKICRNEEQNEYF